MCLAVSFIPVGIIGGFQGFEIATAFLGLIIIVTFFVSLFVSYFITLPIENLTRNIEEISKGNLDVKVEKSEIYEINKLTEALNRVMSSLKLAIHKVGVKKGEIFEETMKAKETAEEKFKLLLNSIDELTWEINEKGVITYCSDNIKDVLGYSSTNIIGKTIYEFIPPEKSKKFRSIFQKAVKKKPQKNNTFKTDLVHKDGYNVPFLTKFHPLFDDLENLIGFRGISKNLLESKMNKEKIEELTNKLSDMRDRMRDILNGKERIKFEPSLEKTTGNLTNNTFNKMLIFDERYYLLNYLLFFLMKVQI
jgi:PAS domain S-box-containing protein